MGDAIGDGFERVVVGDGGHDTDVNTLLVRGRPRCGLSPGGESMATTLDLLGSCGVVIANGAGFRRSGPAMMGQVASSSLSLAHKAALLKHSDDSVLDLARRCDATKRDVRLLTASQLIFGESLGSLSAVLFAAGRHLNRAVHVPQGGVVRFIEDLIGAAGNAGVALHLNAPIVRVTALARGVCLQTSTASLTVDHVVWCCSPAVVQGLVATDMPRFEPGCTVHCVCLDVTIHEEDARTLRGINVLWYANDDDVDFSPAPGGSRPTQALNLLSPTLNGHQPGTRQILCAYAPTNTTVDDVVTRVRQLVQGPLAVHDVQSFDGLG